MKKTLALAALSALVFLPLPALADEAKNLQDFEASLLESKLSDAASAYGRIFDARLPKDGKPVADPTLDALAGRLALATGNVFDAQALLQKSSAGDASNVSARMLATAEAQLLSGNYEAAISASRSAVQSLTGDARTRASIGLVQALIMTGSSEVAALIKTMAGSNPALAWRISFLEAQQALIAKDYPAAQRAGDRAMLQANNAPLRDYAPLQTLQLQAAIAAAQGLRDRTVALLAAVPSSNDISAGISSNIANRLPSCGVDGVGEDDYVTIGMFTQSTSLVAVPSPLAASRPEIVEPFMRSIAGLWRINAGVRIAAYPLMTLRCSATDTTYFQNDSFSFANSSFLAGNNLRPRFLWAEHQFSDDPLTDAAKAFDQIEQRVGADSPILIIPLIELAAVTASQISEDNTLAAERFAQLYRRSSQAYKKIGGSDFGSELDGFQSDPSQYFMRLRSFLETMPIARTYSVALKIIDSEKVPESEKLAIVEITLKQLGGDRRDRRVQTMVSRKATLLRLVGRGAEVESFARATKVDPSLCSAKTVLPVVTDGGITPKDYPSDAIAAEILGRTVVEIDIDSLGKVTRLRKLVEAPALVFASALDSASHAIKFDASRDSKGRATQCKAFRTRIRWEIPEFGITQPEVLQGAGV
jgi:hypothetical protein